MNDRRFSTVLLFFICLLTCVTTGLTPSVVFAEPQSTSIAEYLNTRVINAHHIPAVDTNSPEIPPEEQAWVNNEELLKKLPISDNVTAETTDLLGEQINLDTGTLSFSQMDVSVPGNFALPVEISRSYKGGQLTHSSDLHFGDWDIGIPRVTTELMGTAGRYSGPWGAGRACSMLNADIWHGYQGIAFAPHEYWNGDIVHVPGQFSERLLFNNGTIADNRDYTRVSTAGWRVKCIDTDFGQGFELHSPDGTVYTLDVMRLIYMGQLKQSSRYQAQMLTSKVEDRFGNTVNYHYSGAGRLTSISSSDGRLITLEYNYISVRHRKLVSDVFVNGRQWQYDYVGSDTESEDDDGVSLVRVTRPDNKSWGYSLSQLSFYKPKSVLDGDKALDVCKRHNSYRTIYALVTHPNGTRGRFKLQETLHGRANVDRMRSNEAIDRDFINRCFYAFSLKKKTLTIPNQSTDEVWHYHYSAIEGFYGKDLNTGEVLPKPIMPNDAQLNIALNQDYLKDRQFDAIMYRTTTVESPDGSKTVYYHNRDYHSPIEGKAAVVEVFDTDGTTLLQSTVTDFEQNETANPSIGGANVQFDNPKPHTIRNRVLRRSIYQFKGPNWSEYKTSFTSFNQYNLPKVTIEYHSDLKRYRYTRQSYQQYYDDTYTGFWLLNIPSKTEVSANDTDYKVVSETSYYQDNTKRHALWQPQHFYGAGGRLLKSHSEYHSDGNVKQVEFNVILKDEEGIDSATQKKQYIQYTDYKRGQVGTTTVPKRYSLTNTKTITREIDDNGWVVGTEDYGGLYTSYGYDDIGRLSSIRPHTSMLAGTVVEWDETGLVQTTRRCTVIEGDCVADTAVLSIVKTFDGLFRERDSITTDINRGIAIKQVKSHNVYNQPTFISYPFYTTDSSKANMGVAYGYDGLQRLTRNEEIDQNDNTLTQTQEYLLGNKVKVTDFNGHSTTTTYLSYGQPNQHQPILIESPEQVTTALDVNVFGHITAITQSGPHKDSTITITESRAYNDYHQLCRTHRPDVGQVSYQYHSNGQLAWQATETAPTLTDDLNCNGIAAISDDIKTRYHYDNNGKKWLVHYGDDTESVEYSYNINGDLNSLKAGNILQNSPHNWLRQMTSESLHLLDGNKSWSFSYSYDQLGNQDTITYVDSPVGTLDYAPNAFGQPTQVIGPDGMRYANAVTYYADGQLDSFTYGNGIQYKNDRNSRNLLSQIHAHISKNSTNTDVVKLAYEYDNNKNIDKITDHIDDRYSLYDLTYDGLNRLKTTTGGSEIADSSVSYDALGNIVRYTSRNSFLTYNYNTATNRLMGVTEAHNRYRYDFTNGYDVRGNITNNGTRSFRYNLANQLKSSDLNDVNDVENSYSYDGHNRRVISNDSNNTSYYFYSQSGQLRFRQTDLGRTDHIYLGNLLIAKDGYLPQASNSRMHYKSFGASIEQPKDDVGYTGHKHDPDLKLTYMQQRYYDPIIGRFMGNDPIGFRDVYSFNRYAYANNNPYKFVDPDGRNPITKGLIVAVVACSRNNACKKALKDTAEKAKKIWKGADKRNSNEQRKFRNKVIENNKKLNKGESKCEKCGKDVRTSTGKINKGEKIPEDRADAHHKDGNRNNNDAAKNGELLCNKCHKEEHSSS